MIKEHGGNVYKISRENNIKIEDIIDFSANINPLGVPESGQKAILDAINGLVNYPDPDYMDFRKAIADHHGLSYECIVPGNGAIDSLFSAVAAVNPNKVLVSVPSFVEYEKAVKKSGAEYIPAYRDEEENYALNIEKFISEIHNDIDLVIICNPNNPTGDLVTFDDMVKILNKCKANGTYLLVDEAFMEFAEHFGAKSLDCLIDQYSNLIVSRSLTKYYAVPGLRAGYLIVSDEAIQTNLLTRAEPWKLNYLADQFTQAVLQDENYVHATEKWIVEENKSLYKGLQAIKGIEPVESYANYIFFKCFYPNLKEALLEKSIMIRTCHNYDGMHDNYYRVAVKDKKSNDTLIRVLDEILSN